VARRRRLPGRQRRGRGPRRRPRPLL